MFSQHKACAIQLQKVPSQALGKAKESKGSFPRFTENPLPTERRPRNLGLCEATNDNLNEPPILASSYSGKLLTESIYHGIQKIF